MLQLWHRERFIICLRWSTLVISILIIDLQSSIDNKKVGARSQTTYSPWYGNQIFAAMQYVWARMEQLHSIHAAYLLYMG